MRFIVSFSGGKDSLATLLYVMNNFTKTPEVVFCDTGWEHEKTYQHIKDVEKQTGLKFMVLRSNKYLNFLNLCIMKKRVPSTKARFCTQELKIKPMIDYILSLKEDCVIFQGIRAQESDARSRMDKECTYFKYYFEPYSSNELTIRRLSAMSKISPKQYTVLETAKQRLAAGYKDEKFHTYRKIDVLAWCKQYSADLNRPLFDWLAGAVFAFIHKCGFKENPLYREAFERVGCFPCIMCKQKEVKLIAQKYPQVIRIIRGLETILGRTFFYSKKPGKGFIDEVVASVSDDPNQQVLIEEEPRGCMSIYNICE